MRANSWGLSGSPSSPGFTPMRRKKDRSPSFSLGMAAKHERQRLGAGISHGVPRTTGGVPDMAGPNGNLQRAIVHVSEDDPFAGDEVGDFLGLVVTVHRKGAAHSHSIRTAVLTTSS